MGAYIRNEDGTLTLVERTLSAAEIEQLAEPQAAEDKQDPDAPTEPKPTAPKRGAR